MTSEAAELLPDLPLRMEDDDFTLFGMPRCFAQERAAIDARWKALQAQVHPDRFAAEGAAAQHVAMQWATRVNEAYQRLKDPLARAAYLCLLNGHDVHAAPQPPMPVAFLMQQMALREALEETRGVAHIEALADEAAAQRQTLQAQLAQLIDQQADWYEAAAHVRALMFVARLAEDIEQRLDAVADC